MIAPCAKIVVWPRETKSIIQRQFLRKQPIINHYMHSYFNITLKTSLPPYIKAPCCTSYRYNANYHNHSIKSVSLHPLNYPPCQRYRFADGYPRRYSNRTCLTRLRDSDSRLRQTGRLYHDEPGFSNWRISHSGAFIHTVTLSGFSFLSQAHISF